MDCRPSACRTWGRLSLPPIFLAALACLLACPTLLFWPVDALTIRDAAGRSVLDAPLPLGRAVETEYTHSVQLSPVEDLFHARDGMLHQWRTKIQSQNAGLTSRTAPRSRFFMDPPWLVFQGALLSSRELALRVGDNTLGKNHLRVGNADWIPLFLLFPGERLSVGALRQTLYRLGPCAIRAGPVLRERMAQLLQK